MVEQELNRTAENDAACGGRPRLQIDAGAVAQLRAAGQSWRAIARELGVGCETARRAYQRRPKTVSKLTREAAASSPAAYSPQISSASNGVERFYYKAYPHQKAFHECLAPHRLLGGAAGPGKTLALIEDHMLSCNQFGVDEAKEVHTVIFRRTHPKLEATVITRFREKIPRELYKDYNEAKHVVTWRNGATTQFASMQYEHDVWGWQGQWYKIAFDELTEFTFPQWQNISAWNRCPVSKRPTKDGASNPIGIGAPWVEDLFIKKQPCPEMDQSQKAQYKPENYVYFPATYLDNPIYATDEQYLANLDSYQAPVGRALKLGIWGISGGYFDGAWDEPYNVYNPESVTFEHWHKRWMAADWGFDHNSAIHWFCMDDHGIVRIYRELICNRHTPEELAERIGSMSNGEEYKFFVLAHDAFARRQDENPIALRIGNALKQYGIPMPQPSTKDKPGREQILYDYLKARVRVGEVFNDALGATEPVKIAKLQISQECPNLIRTIEKAPRDEDNREVIAEFLGDDSLQSAGYGLYAMFGKPASIPAEEEVNQRIQELGLTDPTMVAIWQRKFAHQEARKSQPVPFARFARHRRRNNASY